MASLTHVDRIDCDPHNHHCTVKRNTVEFYRGLQTLSKSKHNYYETLCWNLGEGERERKRETERHQSISEILTPAQT